MLPKLPKKLLQDLLLQEKLYNFDEDMYRFTNPLIWLSRIRHRCGYGVHSPFAYRFITEVLYEDLPYYAYDELDKDLSMMDMFRVRKVLHMLIRITNWQQPDLIVCLPSLRDVERYLSAGCKKAIIKNSIPEAKADLCWLSEPNDDILAHLHEHSVLLLDHLNRHREWFRRLPSVVSFDLYDVGIAFFDTKYNKQHYIVNF